jgi:hypothetical protein
MQEEDRSAFADIIQCDRGILDLNFDRFQSSHRSVWYSLKLSDARLQDEQWQRVERLGTPALS